MFNLHAQHKVTPIMPKCKLTQTMKQNNSNYETEF